MLGLFPSEIEESESFANVGVAGEVDDESHEAVEHKQKTYLQIHPFLLVLWQLQGSVVLKDVTSRIFSSDEAN